MCLPLVYYDVSVADLSIISTEFVIFDVFGVFRNGICYHYAHFLSTILLARLLHASALVSVALFRVFYFVLFYLVSAICVWLDRDKTMYTDIYQ